MDILLCSATSKETEYAEIVSQRLGCIWKRWRGTINFYAKWNERRVSATCSAILQIYLGKEPTGEETKWEWNGVYKNNERNETEKKTKKTKSNLEF